jgi:hypothetical protein
MYEIDRQRFSPDDPRFAAALAGAYVRRTRPLCCCRQPGVEMYIAKVGDSHVVKRMPNTGARHAARCASYDPPASLSGLGELLGSAIQTSVIDGLTSLKFDFAMSRRGKQTRVDTGEQVSSGSKPGVTRLTLRATLHYLLDQAGLTRWSPAMEGKRNWWVLRKHLLLAADGKVVKRVPLAQKLFIPEPFSVEYKEQIAQRRQRVFSGLALVESDVQPLMLLVAEVKELGPAKLGRHLRVKHMPDAPFLVGEDLYKRVTGRHAAELSLWNAIDNSHLMVVATFGVSRQGTPTIEEMSLMVLDERWLALENVEEKMLLDALALQKRQFFKTLRFNMTAGAALPSAVLVDGADPVALYIIPSWATENMRLAVAENSGALPSWQWDTTKEMPEFPKAQKP